MYIKITNDGINSYSIRQLKNDNPDVSFPQNPSDELLAKWGVYPASQAIKPTIESWQRLEREQTPTQDSEGNWVFDWVVADVPATSAMVKAEAKRRILHILPEWKQRNLTARATELAIKGVQNWSLEEQTEVAAGQALWNQIKVIRAKSDALEAIDPIPVDYTDDKYWT